MNEKELAKLEAWRLHGVGPTTKESGPLLDYIRDLQRERDLLKRHADEGWKLSAHWTTLCKLSENKSDGLALLVDEMQKALKFRLEEEECDWFAPKGGQNKERCDVVASRVNDEDWNNLFGSQKRPTKPCNYCKAWFLMDLPHAVLLAQAQRKVVELVKAFSCCFGDGTERTGELKDAIAELDKLEGGA